MLLAAAAGIIVSISTTSTISWRKKGHPSFDNLFSGPRSKKEPRSQRKVSIRGSEERVKTAICGGTDGKQGWLVGTCVQVGESRMYARGEAGGTGEKGSQSHGGHKKIINCVSGKKRRPRPMGVVSISRPSGQD